LLRARKKLCDGCHGPRTKTTRFDFAVIEFLPLGPGHGYLEAILLGTAGSLFGRVTACCWVKPSVIRRRTRDLRGARPIRHAHLGPGAVITEPAGKMPGRVGQSAPRVASKMGAEGHEVGVRRFESLDAVARRRSLRCQSRAGPVRGRRWRSRRDRRTRRGITTRVAELVARVDGRSAGGVPEAEPLRQPQSLPPPPPQPSRLPSRSSSRGRRRAPLWPR
jgi:hypothetical protein